MKHHNGYEPSLLNECLVDETSKLLSEPVGTSKYNKLLDVVSLIISGARLESDSDQQRFFNEVASLDSQYVFDAYPRWEANRFIQGQENIDIWMMHAFLTLCWVRPQETPTLLT